MNKTFIYLVPSTRSSYYKIRNEYFIIDELRKLGHEVKVVSSFYALTIKRIYKHQKIDGIIFNSLKLIMHRQNILNWSKQNNIAVYWWYFDTATSNEKRQHRVEQIAKDVTTFFNKDHSLFDIYKSKGIFPVWLDQGVGPICQMHETTKFKFDLGFFGSFHAVHKDRTEMLKRLDEQYSLAIYTPDVTKFRDAGFHHVFSALDQKSIGLAVAEIRIVLVLNFSNTLPYYWSDRIHLMTGSGAFCLAEHIEGIETIYSPDADIIFFNDEAELHTNIEKWLSPSLNDQRETIRENGFAKAHDKNSYKKRVLQFLDSMGSIKNNE